jgi:RNA polymerase sigma-70 factor (ECF subfamily)
MMAANGSREQLFEELFRSCTGRIEHIAVAHEADPALRGELVQEILLALWTALPGFRGDASIATFAASVARKRCATHVSKRAREPRQVALPADLACPAPAPDEAALREDEKRLLTRSVGLLPVPQREAIVLCLAGFAYGEMAVILGISTNAVMLRCQRAKSRLRAVLAGVT